MTDPVPWAFAPGGDVVETMEWLTDVLGSKTGEEQRRRLRESPRMRLEFEGLESGAPRRWMETQLQANGGGRWDVPLACDTLVLSAPLPAGSGVVPIAVNGRRFAAGGRALLAGAEPRPFEVVQIAGVDPDGLTLVEPTNLDWPSGARLVPLEVGRFSEVPSLQRFTSDDVPVSLSWDLLEDIDWPASAGSATYREYPVLEWRPVWTADPEHQAERSLDIVDELTGAPAVFDLPGMPLQRQVLQYVLTNRTEIGAFRGLLFALAGRWASIWIPSWAHDLRVVFPVAAEAVVMDVEWCGLSDWPLAVNRRDVRLELVDGSVLYRRLTDVVQISDSIERVTLDAALGLSVQPKDVAMLSFMALARQDTDINVLRWWDADVALSELSFRGFRHDV